MGLGDKVKDVDTGFTGIVTAYAESFTSLHQMFSRGCRHHWTSYRVLGVSRQIRESRGLKTMGKFEDFNKAINKDQLKKDMAQAKENEYAEVPAGRYEVKFEKMEIGETSETAKTPHAPMFKLMARLVDAIREDDNGKQLLSNNVAVSFMDKRKNGKKPCVFMNKVIYVANETEKWNTGKAIQTVVSFLGDIGSETPIVFENYDQFSDLVLDLAEECQSLVFDISYDPEGFNTIRINDVWEE